VQLIGLCQRIALLVATLGAMGRAATAETIADFEDLVLSSGSYWNGSDGSGGFTSGGAEFNNAYDPEWGSWSGWAYSNVNNTTTPGWLNQYAAYTGTGYGASGNYAVACWPVWEGAVPTMALPPGMSIETMKVTNTTYVALSMLNGDGFARKFGWLDANHDGDFNDAGDHAGNYPDWFKLTITGKDAEGGTVGQLDVYLADYRFPGTSSDYLVNTWQTVDLTGLADARELQFDLLSSDVGEFGMNTPAYFAVDHVTMTATPEPSTIVAVFSGGVALLVRRRRRWRVENPLRVART